MSITDVVNVAGSIGGVANAIGDLFGPGAGSWEASLQKASFGGVPFGVTTARTHAGRRTAVHVYPYRDDVWAEDQGKLPRQFRIHGFLIEDSLVYGGGGVVAQREALISVCETSGPKTLVHPTFGTVQSVVCVGGIEVEERKDLGRVFEFTMTAMVTGERQYPGTEESTEDAVGEAAEEVREKSLLDLAGEVAEDIRQGAAVVQQAVSTVVGYYQMAVGIVNRVRRVFNAVSNLAGNFGRLFGGGNSGFSGSNRRASRSTSVADALAADVAASAAVVAAGERMQLAAANIADTDAYAVTVRDFVAAVAATAVDPADRISMLSELASFAPASMPSTSPVGQAMASMSEAIAAHLRRSAIAELAEAVTQYQPASQNDAAAVQTTVTEVVDAEILVAGDSGDDASYESLRAVRKSIVADLQARGADLAEIGAFAFAGTMPALALANRIYRDAGRADELVRQVDPVHPAFMPPRFEALSK